MYVVLDSILEIFAHEFHHIFVSLAFLTDFFVLIVCVVVDDGCQFEDALLFLFENKFVLVELIRESVEFML